LVALWSNSTKNHGKKINRGVKIPWPPRSPYLTSLNFSLWGFVKDVVYVRPVSNNFEAVNIRITRAMQQMDEGMLSRIWTEED